jgi:hypothetical protein
MTILEGGVMEIEEEAKKINGNMEVISAYIYDDDLLRELEFVQEIGRNFNLEKTLNIDPEYEETGIYYLAFPNVRESMIKSIGDFMTEKMKEEYSTLPNSRLSNSAAVSFYSASTSRSGDHSA